MSYTLEIAISGRVDAGLASDSRGDGAWDALSCALVDVVGQVAVVPRTRRAFPKLLYRHHYCARGYSLLALTLSPNSESVDMSASIDSETLKQYLADSPPTVVPLTIKPHFEALTDQEKLYAHHVSM
jgi:hypothetical protein